MHLPPDCAELDAFDWSPLVDTNSTLDTDKPGREQPPLSETRTRPYKGPNQENYTRKRPAIHTSGRKEATC